MMTTHLHNSCTLGDDVKTILKHQLEIFLPTKFSSELTFENFMQLHREMKKLKQGSQPPARWRNDTATH